MSAIQLTTSNPRRKSSRSWTLIGAVGALAVLSLIRSQYSSPVDVHSHKDTSESLQQPVLRPFGAFASSIASLHRGSSHKTFAHQVATQATQSCEVCVATPDDPLCEYGLDNIRLSRAYEGSGTRVRRVLQRAIRGEEIRIGVLGASVTVSASCTHLHSPSDLTFIAPYRLATIFEAHSRGSADSSRISRGCFLQRS